MSAGLRTEVNTKEENSTHESNALKDGEAISNKITNSSLTFGFVQHALNLARVKIQVKKPISNPKTRRQTSQGTQNVRCCQGHIIAVGTESVVQWIESAVICIYIYIYILGVANG